MAEVFLAKDQGNDIMILPYNNLGLGLSPDRLNPHRQECTAHFDHDDADPRSVEIKHRRV